MKNLKQNILLAVAALSLTLTSCHKDPKVNLVTGPVTSGVYVLNQGLFNANNSTLSFYDNTSLNVTTDIFTAANGRGLGDTGNDVEIYGSKMYIVVNVSSTIEVVDKNSAKSIKQIKLLNNAFVTSYDGTVAVIDTAALTVSQYITVGRNPEQLTVANGKLYVANSGGLSFPNFDKTVSVIDLTSLTVIKTLTVTINPQNVVADSHGNVYVLSAGDYNTIPSGLTIIDDVADVVKTQTNFDGSGMIIQGDNLYFITSANKIIVYNAVSQSITNTNFISDGTVITTPYSIGADAVTGEVFVTDAKNFTSNGSLFVFDKTGKKEYSTIVGVNPGKVAILKK